jgi:hypothetical protein
MPIPDPEVRKAALIRFQHMGSGHFKSNVPYCDTLTMSEFMALRGYQLVDGKWVP